MAISGSVACVFANPWQKIIPTASLWRNSMFIIYCNFLYFIYTGSALLQQLYVLHTPQYARVGRFNAACGMTATRQSHPEDSLARNTEMWTAICRTSMQ